ncbi:MAG: 30S ribosomal protein S9 [Parcubacteria group bacterium]|jgi:small subunit ribosomal protein S9|nr:30S ribosomal protein S9 [Parcubacteria group bacterium]|tara:strand:+ start:2927 stop:3487 length:561 start_codon:yes stop_codon:yes gene_type:complete
MTDVKKPRRKVGIPTRKASGESSKIKKTPLKKALVKKAKDKALVKKKAAIDPKRYFEAVGRRKKSVARVRLFTCRPFEDSKGKININGKFYTDFFSIFEFQQIVADPLKKMKSLNRFEATVKVKGGGSRGQAEAIRHGLARTLVEFNPDFSKKLKRAGFLTRDPRRKERKKPGLKKARRAPQWSKR